MLKESQVETTSAIVDFLQNFKINTPEDLVLLRNKIVNYLKVRPYNTETKQHADSIQWKRTASQILEDKYVYDGKACSDLTITFLACCKVVNIPGRLIKLKKVGENNTHSISEVQLSDDWYSYDIQTTNAKPRKGEIKSDQIYISENGNSWIVYAKGRDVWDLGLNSIESEQSIYK